jgi:hypothetical protein
MNVGSTSLFGNIGSMSDLYKKVSENYAKTGGATANNITNYVKTNPATSANTYDSKGISYVKDLKNQSKDLSAAVKGISKDADAETAVKQAQNFVDSYNKLYSTAATEGGAKGEQLAAKMVSANKPQINRLASVGISFASDGQMSLNTETATKAAQGGKLQGVLSDGKGTNYGYAQQIDKVAKDANQNTGKYVSSTQFTGTDADASQLYTRSMFQTFGKTSIAAGMPGMMMDFLV